MASSRPPSAAAPASPSPASASPASASPASASPASASPASASPASAKPAPASAKPPPPRNHPPNGQPAENGRLYGTTTTATTAAQQPQPPHGVSKRARARALAPDLLRGALSVFMLVDHVAVMLQAWPHGLGRTQEGDGFVVARWAAPVPYALRLLAHLCAPGFGMLMGMGVVFLVRSRAPSPSHSPLGSRGNGDNSAGWSAARLALHFTLRGTLLVAVSVALGLLMSLGQLWFLNVVLAALGFNYVLAGLVYLGVRASEDLFARALNRVLPRLGFSTDDDAADVDDTDAEAVTRPLLAPSPSDANPRGASTISRGKVAGHLAASISWHVHNALLVAASIVTIFWNIWLSEHGGHCGATTSTTSITSTTVTVTAPPTPAPASTLFRLFFWPFLSPHAISEFPLLAWTSFSLVGLIYGRLLVAAAPTSHNNTPRARRLNILAHALAGLAFILVFVLTRLLRLGNLSDGCLRTPEHLAQPPGANPYLASLRSFLYTVKYPPDVAFWAQTMGACFLLLAGFDALPARAASWRVLAPLLDYGASPLFFYTVHIMLAVLMAVVCVPLFGREVDDATPIVPGIGRRVDNPVVVLAAVVLLLAVMWPLCRQYGRFKSTKPKDSLWRFF